jgi:hypothetical protein
MPRDYLANLVRNLPVRGDGLIHPWRQDSSVGVVRELRHESRPDFRKNPWQVARHTCFETLLVCGAMFRSLAETLVLACE